jgi:hypothetical protein
MSNANKPAFPLASDDHRDLCALSTSGYGGLTKLEYFAGLAMQGIVARQWYNADGMATDAVTCARALLAEFEKEKGV